MVAADATGETIHLVVVDEPEAVLLERLESSARRHFGAPDGKTLRTHIYWKSNVNFE